MKKLPNILIVDDNQINLAYIEAVTRKIDVNLIQALSGYEALEKTRGVELALAILDVMMPEMNGYELALKLNEDRSDDKVPVIFLTANHVNEVEEFKGYSSGAVDYIFKPVNNQILQSKVNVFLNLFEQKQTIVDYAKQLKTSADELIKTNVALKKREEILQQEQLFTKALLDSIPGIFYLYTYPDLRMVTWNKQHETLFGYEASEMKDRYVLDWHKSETRESVLRSLDNFQDSGQATVETQLLTKDGRAIPFLLTAVKFESNGQNYLIGVGTDITERKRAEDELKISLEQLHQLSQYIEQVRENERIAISRELHDDLGQSLTAVKIDLGIIKQKVSDDETVNKINKVTTLVGDTIKTVQRLTSQLRPEIIDDLGLEAAIEWYTNEFAQRTGITAILDVDPGIINYPGVSLIVFRILQESLTNIARHSGATEVHVTLSLEKDFIELKISDNGIGITDEQRNSKQAFGLISMKERAASLGGTFSISCKNGNGTVITLVIPVSNK